MDGFHLDKNMNFLAHLFLSGEDEHLLVGNFLADFIKNKEVAKLPRPLQEGVRLHRKIDDFTDHHPIVRQSVRRLRPVHGKYAPVILDVFYDYLLVKNWDRYAALPLGVFTQSVYQVLNDHLFLMPLSLQERLPRMIASDWLAQYGTEEGLRFTFSRMKLRSSFPHFFDHAVESLEAGLPHFNEEFNLFFPDAIAMAKGWGLRSE